MSDDEVFEDVLLTAGSSMQPLLVKYSEFEGKKLLDIRKYYKTKDGDLKPTKKGVSLNHVQFEAISNAFVKKGDEIDKWLLSGVKGKTAEVLAAEETRFRKDNFTVVIGEWSGLEMFSYESNGNASILKLNNKHPWIASLLEESDGSDSARSLKTAIHLIQSFCQAMNLFDSRSNISNEFSETLLGNWSIFSRKYENMKNN